jgi:hypothetical protein
MAGVWLELGVNQEALEELEDGATQQEAPKELNVADEADDQP